MSLKRWAAAIAGALAITVTLSSPPANATQTNEDPATRRANHAATVARAAAATLDQGNSAAKLGAAASLSHSGRGAIRATNDGIDVELTIPNADRGLVDTNNGATVASGGSVDTVLEARPGGVRAMVVLHNSSAPDRFEYAVTGASFEMSGSGTVLLQRGDKTIGFVAPAWAISADGKRLPTSYDVRDGRLIQHVAHAGAVYPVVADPTVSFGWYVYVRYSKQEVKDWRALWELGLDAGYLVCVPLSLGWLVAACLWVIDHYHGSIRDTINTAAANNQCFEIRYTYNGTLVGWRNYNC